MSLGKLKALVSIMGVAALVLALGCSSADPTPIPAAKAPAAPTATSVPAATATPLPAATATPTQIPAPTPDLDKPKYGGIAIFANRGDPPGWDPMYVGTITMKNIAYSMYGDGNLLRPCRDDVFAVCAARATKWTNSDDFKTWTFTLRDDILWHDWKVFDAESVKFWYELATTPPDGRKTASWAANLGDIESLKADGNTLTVTLKEANLRYLDSLVSNTSMTMAHPPHLVNAEIKAGNPTVGPNGTNYVATGPFKFDSYVKGSVVKVRRNEQYWETDKYGQQMPYLDGIDYPIIKDQSAALAAFRTGRTDGTARGSRYFVKPTDREIITKELGDKVWYADFPSYPKYLAVDSISDGPWKDVRVRRAAHLWINNQEGITAIHGGDAQIIGAWPQYSPFANKDINDWPGLSAKTKAADREQAKKLLADAGYPDGFKAEVMCRSAWIDYCEFIEGQLSGLLGMGNVKLDVVDTATFRDRNRAGKYTLNASSHSVGITPEGQALTWSYLNKGGAALHNDQKVDEMFAAMGNEADSNERIKKAQALERYMIQDKVYGISMWFEVGVVAYRSHIRNMAVAAILNHTNLDHSTVWMDK